MSDVEMILLASASLFGIAALWAFIVERQMRKSAESTQALLTRLTIANDFQPPLVTHPDGKVFYRNSADQWMPL